MEDSPDVLGPGAEFTSVYRRKAITDILVALRGYEQSSGLRAGALQFPTATWFALSLADISRLQAIARSFVENAQLAWPQNKCSDLYILVSLCMVDSFPS